MARSAGSLPSPTGSPTESLPSLIESLPCLLEEVTLDEVSERAAAARSAAGGQSPTEAELEAARARARTIIGEARRAGPGGTAGLDEMRVLQLQLILAVGMPVPRILFGQMVARSGASAEKRSSWAQQLGQVSDVEEVGCISVEFPDRQLGRSNTVFLVLAECEASHDLGAQLDALYSRIPEVGQAEIRKQLSVLVYLGRAAYRHAVDSMTAAFVEVALESSGASQPFNPLNLMVDAANTTLYVPHSGPRRVGIFVRYAEEVAKT